MRALGQRAHGGLRLHAVTVGFVRASVVVVNFNLSRFLREAIDSALRQPNAEVVVVDDKSTDGSVDIIASYRDRIIPVLLPQNVGHLEAFAAGVERSSGEVIFALDADDMCLPNRVPVCLEAFANDPAIVQVAGRQVLIDADGTAKAFCRATGNRFVPRQQVRPTSGDAASLMLQHGTYNHSLTSGMAWRRAELLTALAERPSDRRFVDNYLAAAMPFLGPVAGLDEPVFAYRHHDTNSVGNTGDAAKHVALRQLHLATVNDWAERCGRADRLRAANYNRLVLDSFAAGETVTLKSRVRAVARSVPELWTSSPGLLPGVIQAFERLVMATSPRAAASMVDGGVVRATSRNLGAYRRKRTTRS